MNNITTWINFLIIAADAAGKTEWAETLRTLQRVKGSLDNIEAHMEAVAQNMANGVPINHQAYRARLISKHNSLVSRDPDTGQLPPI